MSNNPIAKTASTDEAEANLTDQKPLQFQLPAIHPMLKLPKFKLHDGGSSRAMPLRKELALKIQEFQLWVLPLIFAGIYHLTRLFIIYTKRNVNWLVVSFPFKIWLKEHINDKSGDRQWRMLLPAILLQGALWDRIQANRTDFLHQTHVHCHLFLVHTMCVPRDVRPERVVVLYEDVRWWDQLCGCYWGVRLRFGLCCLSHNLISADL